MRVRFTSAVTLIGKTVSSEDALGDDIYTPTSTITDGVFAPGGSVEVIQGRDQVTTQPTVFLRTGVDVTAVDQIVVNGETFEVDGDPKNWPANAFTGWLPEYPLEVALRRVTG